MNTTVQATGLKVKASAGTGLVISAWDNDAGQQKYTTPAQSVATNNYNHERAYTAYEPTSTVNANNWYKATAAAANDEAPTVDSTTSQPIYVSVGSFTNKYSSSIYYYDRLKIQTNDGQNITGKDLKITTISVDDGSDAQHVANSEDLNKALRLIFVVTCNNVTTTYFYAPAYATYPDVKGVKTAATTGYEAIAMNDSSLGLNLYGNTGTIVLSDNVVYGETIVDVYMYYDGEDENCFTNNTLAGIDTLTVDLTFAAVDHT